MNGSRVPANGSRATVNGSRVPPDGSRVPANGSRLPPDGSRVPANGSRIPPDGSRVAANGSRLPPDSSGVPGNGSRLPADGPPQVPAIEITTNHGHNTSPDNSDDESDTNDSQRKPRAARNSKPQGETKPSQLGFYSGAWVGILITARNNYSNFIHTGDKPFPERTIDNLQDVHNFLMEAIGEFRENGGVLDESVFIFYIHFKFQNSFLIC